MTRSQSSSPVVASALLAEGSMPALSEFEFALTIANNAFERWMVRCMAAAGVPDLSALDIMVLMTVQHRGKPKRIADICLLRNIEDTHLVTYSVKKLERLKLVKSGKQGKEKVVQVTPAGEEMGLRYREVRDVLLLKTIKSLGIDAEKLSAIAAEMRVLSGHYDQAARAAASL